MENTATVSGTEVKKYRRAGFMDEVRGFCILCMVVYHVCFDLNYTYNIHIPIMFDGWFDIVRDIFAGAFMFISGMSSRYSHNNAKRGIQCFFIGIIITFIFAFFAPTAHRRGYTDRTGDTSLYNKRNRWGRSASPHKGSCGRQGVPPG